MKTRPERGVGVFYHRDSEGHSDLAPPQYVNWARGEAAKLGVAFSGTAETITAMIASGRSVDHDLYLDFGISGNHLSRPALDALRSRIHADRVVTHLFVSKRDRLARPDNPLDGMQIEIDLLSAGLTIVFMGGLTLHPIVPGQRIDMGHLLKALIDYDASGRFRRDLAEKLIHAKIRLAQAGYAIGGQPLYGFRRWLCAEDGTRKRELAEGEIVKMAGCHVVWLPTAAEELKVVMRILDLIETTPAARIARMFNAEGVPSPKAGRGRKVKGVAYEFSGLWTQTTVRNLATHSLLIAVCEYGKRAEGDQMRFTKNGPRPLGPGDYHDDGTLRTVANPAEHVIRTAAKHEPLIPPERLARIQAVVEHRGRHLKGKARTRGESPNPLGGRIFDITCGWGMYRYAKRGRWCYGCGLYMNSAARCCRHNVVEGERAARFVLACLRQRVLNPSTLAKLKARLRELAAAHGKDDPAERQRDADAADLAAVRRKLGKVAENMALAETPAERTAMAEVFGRLKDQEAAHEQRVATHGPAAPLDDPEREVEAALGTLDRLADCVVNIGTSWTAVGEIFRQTNAKLFLRFAEVERGRRTFSVPSGGVVTFGNTPPPGPLYTGPTDRAIIREMINAGEPVTAIPECVAPGSSDAGQDVSRSGNVKRGTIRCT